MSKGARKSDTYAGAINNSADEHGTTCAQVFVGGPRQRRLTNIRHEVDEWPVDTKVYAHAAYPDISVWKLYSEKEDEVEKAKLSVDFVKEEMDLCRTFGIKGFVLHLPKGSLETVLNVLPSIVHKKVWIYLEAPAYKPTTGMTWESAEAINNLCEGIRSMELKRVGICIDTAHLWCGLVSIKTSSEAKQWLRQLKYPKMIKMIHLNDSDTPFGVHKDVHRQIFQGHIWKDVPPEQSGCKTFVKFAKKYKIPIILERQRVKNEGIEEEYSYIRNFLSH